MISSVQGSKIALGWREWIALPDLGIPAVKAKIDTGVRTSCLHTFGLEVVESDGHRKVRFGIHPLQGRTDIVRYCITDVVDRRMVSDSGGHHQRRWVIRTMAVVGGVAWPLEITLADRDGMRFRMLLGRSALSDRFIINPAGSYLTGRKLAHSYGQGRLKRRKTQ